GELSGRRWGDLAGRQRGALLAAYGENFKAIDRTAPPPRPGTNPGPYTTAIAPSSPLTRQDLPDQQGCSQRL
ncbi:hypothetical protein ACIA74_40085, partial [Streptomyces sp. NPDC051658]|uniref:hypothetical protein n=1 Tax=Streptomyces sp. NPDC051658 TaxID=3365667 RepID=UPI0037B91C9E